jgi:hypothetical protein
MDLLSLQAVHFQMHHNLFYICTFLNILLCIWPVKYKLSHPWVPNCLIFFLYYLTLYLTLSYLQILDYMISAVNKCFQKFLNFLFSINWFLPVPLLWCLFWDLLSPFLSCFFELNLLFYISTASCFLAYSLTEYNLTKLWVQNCRGDKLCKYSFH